MASDGSGSKKNKFVSTKTLFGIGFIIIALIVSYISKDIYLTKTEEYKDNIYKKTNEDILKRFQNSIDEKLNISLLVASSLSKENKVKKSLLLKDRNILDMDKLLEEMRTKNEFVDIQVEIIDSKGISFSRSWVNNYGDDLVKNDTKLAHIIKYPKVFSQIKSTKFGMTFSSKIPLYENNKFIGLFGVNMHFNSLVDSYSKEGFNSIVLLNEKDSKKIIQDMSYSKLFIDNCYVVNANADKYLVRLLKENTLKTFCENWDNDYKINKKSDHLISKYIIKNEFGEPKSMIFIFKSIDEIDLIDLELIQQIHIIATILFLFILLFLINYMYMIARTKELNIENEELIVINENLKIKTDEMDFNDKKLDNMFNMQPNLMIMHNGKEVTKANKRFMGFFNRFGTFDGFKKKHRCVSELFEKYEAPNYIWEQHLESEFWVDYILNNPRRLYKTVMSINGDPHHFIIKLNELDYAKHVSERVIIIALVDMTQDLVNYKTLGESKQVLTTVNEKLEIKEEEANTDISYLLKNEIKETTESLLMEDISNINFTKAKISQMKNRAVKIVCIYKFDNIESQWTFFIPALTSSKILNTMLKDKNAKVVDHIDKDIIDTAREFIYTMSINFCNKINSEKFHDLYNVRYIQSSVAEAVSNDISSLENVYKIDLSNDNLKFNIFVEFDKDIIPFIEKIIYDKEITSKSKVNTIEKIESSKKSVDNVKVDEDKKIELYRKTDFDSLVINGSKDMLRELLDKDVTSSKLLPSKIYKIKDKNCVQFNNEFKINGESSKWSLLITAETLSLISNIKNDDIKSMLIDVVDKSLKNLADTMIKSMVSIIGEKTDNKIELIASNVEVKDKILFSYGASLFSLNFIFGSQKFEFYILIEEKD